jgi:hypothetical protein
MSAEPDSCIILGWVVHEIDYPLLRCRNCGISMEAVCAATRFLEDFTREYLT